MHAGMFQARRKRIEFAQRQILDRARRRPAASVAA
jgi:hypothetical protein